MPLMGLLVWVWFRKVSLIRTDLKKKKKKKKPPKLKNKKKTGKRKAVYLRTVGQLRKV